MGTVIHEALIVTVPEYALSKSFMPDVEGFRASMPAEFQELLVGPIPAIRNGDVTYFFAADGSKLGWDVQMEGSRLRQEFADLFTFVYEDGSGPFDVVRVRYGSDLFMGAHGPRAQVDDLSPRQPYNEDV